MPVKKLEARLCSNRLKVYDVNGFSRSYLGYVALDIKDIKEEDLKNSTLFLYSKRNPYLKRVPKFEIKIMYGDPIP